MVKPLVISVFAVAAGLALFAAMYFMIQSDEVFEKDDSNRAHLNFIRVDPADPDVQTKERDITEPPPPPEEPPETPDFAADIDSASASMSMSMPSIGVSMDRGSGGLGALQKGQGMSGFDTDVIPVVRVPPTYPRRARQAGIEGWVTMEVTIRPDGTVADAEVIESDPPRLFDEAAMNAMERWKFRPKVVDGSPVAQRAKQTIEFTLDR